MQAKIINGKFVVPEDQWYAFMYDWGAIFGECINQIAKRPTD